MVQVFSIHFYLKHKASETPFFQCEFSTSSACPPNTWLKSWRCCFLTTLISISSWSAFPIFQPDFYLITMQCNYGNTGLKSCIFSYKQKELLFYHWVPCILCHLGSISSFKKRLLVSLIFSLLFFLSLFLPDLYDFLPCAVFSLCSSLTLLFDTLFDLPDI